MVTFNISERSGWDDWDVPPVKKATGGRINDHSSSRCKGDFKRTIKCPDDVSNCSLDANAEHNITVRTVIHINKVFIQGLLYTHICTIDLVYIVYYTMYKMGSWYMHY